MTDARVSQLAVEVLRTDLAAAAQVSQLAVEVLRPNAGRGISAVAGAFTLTGVASTSHYARAIKPDAGAFSLTGVDAGSLRHYIAIMDGGAFTLTGQNSSYLRPGRLFAATGDFSLTGLDAQFAISRYLAVAPGAFVLTGQAAVVGILRTLVAAPGAFTLTGTPSGRGLSALAGAFTLTGVAATSQIAHARVISEIVNFSDPATVKWTASTTNTDRYTIADRWKTAMGYRLAETVTHSETLAVEVNRVAAIVDQILIDETCTPVGSFRTTVLDAVKIADLVQTAFPATLTDSVTANALTSGIIGLLILDRLTTTAVLDGDAKYAAALLDAIRAGDSLARFLDGTLSESMTITATLIQKANLSKALADVFNLTDSAAGKLLIRVSAEDETIFDDATASQWIFAPTLTDTVNITIGYVEPSGSFTTWAVNTRTGAVTEYQNYVFNSFAQLGHKYLGADSTGLYELNGDDDEGADIIPHIKSGYAQFGGSKYTSFKAAYLGMRGSGDIILKLDTGDGKTYTYQTVVQDMQSTKVRLGKGLRARYFAFELIGTGPDFDLDTVEFIPLVAQRRV